VRLGMKATMLATTCCWPAPARWDGRRHGVHDQRALRAAQGARGYRLGHGQIFDHMFLDGLEDAYEGKLMGTSPI
jgi:acetyl-CoA C-acetyltransferase